MTLEAKLRALIAGMRYAATKCEEYATVESWAQHREAELARASAYRSNAKALEAILDAHANGDEVTRDAR